jgi:multicomponent Na+:H+ antiporter subunit E
MNAAFLVVILALLWAAMTGSFSGINLVFGAVVGGAIVLLLRKSLLSSGSLRRAGHIVSLFGLFFYELMASAIRVALIVLRPDMQKVICPAIVAVPLSVRSDVEITLLANLITLTPGTLSVDISADRSKLYVHTLLFTDRDALIAEIKNGFEKKVLEIFQ